MYKEGVSSSKVVLDAFCGNLGARLALFFFFFLVLTSIIQKPKRCSFVKIAYGYPERNIKK